MSAQRRGDKSVYYHADKFLHVVKVMTKENKPASQNGLKRWAFLVVGEEEVKELIKTKESEQDIRDAIKGKYLPYLEEAYKEELANLQEMSYRPEYWVKNKYISTLKSRSKEYDSLGSLLRKRGFSKEYEFLEDAHKQASAMSHFLYMEMSIARCEGHIAKEIFKTKINVGKPYAVVALPFYHKRKNQHYLAGAMYPDLASVALMPKRVVEYGVFFDGTKNNKYNIDFYRSFDKFLKKETKIVESKKELLLETKKDLADYTSGADYIVTVDKPKKEQAIMDMIRKEITDSVRYFEEDSIYRDSYKRYFQDDASDHAEKVFDFLVDVKEEDRVEKEINRAVKKGKIKDDAKSRDWYRPLVFQFFIEKNILPSNAKDTSYVNGVTNIERLFNLYKGKDQLNPPDEHEEAHLEYFDRYKVYASGSGTTDPHNEKELDTDRKVGLGVAGGETGMRAHIIYTCEKMADELRNAGIYKVDELVLDVFGFSRGAAEARHFVCSIMEEFNQKKEATRSYNLDLSKHAKEDYNIFSPFYEQHRKGKYGTINGVFYYNPLFVGKDCDINSPYREKQKLEIKSVSFRFVGLYDTVTHEGIIQGNDAKYMNLDFDSKKTGRVIHMRAKDEHRYNFETTSIKKTADEKLADNMDEMMLPGAHADVGGAYNLGANYKPVIYEGTEIESASRGGGVTVRIGDSDKKLLKAWHDKYKWFDKEYSLVKVYALDEIEKNKVDGFYEINNAVYMYRQNISNGYEFVTLKLMYDQAMRKDVNASKLKEQKVLAKRELVPFNNIEKFENGKYKIENENKIATDEKKKLNGFLQKVYKTLKDEGVSALGDDMITLRQNYLHHSSNYVDIANPPSKAGSRDKKEIYGQRVVHGSQGAKFPYDPR